MEKRPLHRCKCPACRSRQDSPTKQLHTHINFLLSTLDEHQRRLYVGLESQRLGHGGDRLLAQITGLSVDTIAAGRRELQTAQQTERIRVPGEVVAALKKRLDAPSRFSATDAKPDRR